MDSHVVICGKPHTGKTTLARKMCGPDDIVFDLDAIAAALNPDFATIDKRPARVAYLILNWRVKLIESILDPQDCPGRCIVIMADRKQALHVARQIGAQLIV